MGIQGTRQEASRYISKYIHLIPSRSREREMKIWCASLNDTGNSLTLLLKFSWWLNWTWKQSFILNTLSISRTMQFPLVSGLVVDTIHGDVLTRHIWTVENQLEHCTTLCVRSRRIEVSENVCIFTLAHSAITRGTYEWRKLFTQALCCPNYITQ